MIRMIDFSVSRLLILRLLPMTHNAPPRGTKEPPMKTIKYLLLTLALVTPAIAYAASGDCDCPCCPIKGGK
jgi:hypothetical protein